MVDPIVETRYSRFDFSVSPVSVVRLADFPSEVAMAKFAESNTDDSAAWDEFLPRNTQRQLSDMAHDTLIAGRIYQARWQELKQARRARNATHQHN